jgi:hypothetical protein
MAIPSQTIFFRAVFFCGFGSQSSSTTFVASADEFLPRRNRYPSVQKCVDQETLESLATSYGNFMKTKEVIKTAHDLAKPFRVRKGKDFRLKDVDPDDTLEFTKEADKPRAKEALAMGVAALAELQDKLYAQDKWAVLLIFQAMDAAGKDGAIKYVMSGVNPQGCEVYSFKSPSSEDLDHDYLWRCMKCLPNRNCRISDASYVA